MKIRHQRRQSRQREPQPNETHRLRASNAEAFGTADRKGGIAIAHNDLVAALGGNADAGQIEGEEDVIAARWCRMFGLYLLPQPTEGPRHYSQARQRPLCDVHTYALI